MTMPTGSVTEGSGCARYTFRVRVSSMARRGLEAEWDRSRWVWNECVAKSKQVHQHNKAAGEKRTWAKKVVRDHHRTAHA